MSSAPEILKKIADEIAMTFNFIRKHIKNKIIILQGHNRRGKKEDKIFKIVDDSENILLI